MTTETVSDTWGCRGNTVATRSGKYLDFENPQPDQIELADIAAGLAKSCRFGGQIGRFYSVAEHCWLGAEYGGTNNGFRLAFLLHDAAEAYMGDIQKPLKLMLGEYWLGIERRVQNAINERLGVGQLLDQWRDQVKTVDRRLLLAEKRWLFPHTSNWSNDNGVEPLPDVAGHFSGWLPEDAEKRWLWTVEQYLDACGIRLQPADAAPVDTGCTAHTAQAYREALQAGQDIVHPDQLGHSCGQGHAAQFMPLDDDLELPEPDVTIDVSVQIEVIQ